MSPSVAALPNVLSMARVVARGRGAGEAGSYGPRVEWRWLQVAATSDAPEPSVGVDTQLGCALCGMRMASREARRKANHMDM